MSSKPFPTAAQIDSSASPASDSVRPKRLGLHESNVQALRIAASAPVQNPVRENTDEPASPDSCNVRAAALLASEREAMGITVEEAAELAGVSATTIWRRENGLVDLGPLKHLLTLTKARALKVKAGK